MQVNVPLHLAIIEKSRWLKVQERIDRNPKFSKRNAQAFYLLQGLLSCGYCGAAYSGHCSKYNGKAYLYYRCWKRTCKVSRWIPAPAIESAIWDVLKRALLNPRHLHAQVGRARAAMTDKPRPQQRQDAQSRTQLQQQESLLFHNYRTGKLSADELAKELERVKHEFDLQVATTAKTGSPGESKVLGRPLEELCHRIAQQLEQPRQELRQELLRRVIIKAVVFTEKVHVHARISVDDQDISPFRPAKQNEDSPTQGNEQNTTRAICVTDQPPVHESKCNSELACEAA